MAQNVEVSKVKEIAKGETLYYNLDHIMSLNAKYNVIFGERSNGKTYACLEYGLKRYSIDKSQMAIIRRWDTDFNKRACDELFAGHVKNNLVEKYTHGEWTDIYYRSARWYFSKKNAKGDLVIAKEPFAYGFSLSTSEHDKGSSYPGIRTVLFDEFIARGAYLPNEFDLFTNTLSTIIRRRNDFTIFLCGNTINPHNPYFKNMGLYRAKNQEQGTIDLYKFGDSKLTVACEYTQESASKPSDVYFAFDNPKLNMITKGGWELNIYQRLPHRIMPKDIIFTYFIEYEDDLFQCEVIEDENSLFTYIHQKTGEIKYPDDDLIYSTKESLKPNWRNTLCKPTNKTDAKLYKFFVNKKVCYQDNFVGETINSFLLDMKRMSV